MVCISITIAAKEHASMSYMYNKTSMRGSRKFCQKRSNFDNVFFFFLSFFYDDEGNEDLSSTISGPSSGRQRNAIIWRSTGVPLLAQH